MRPGRVRAAPLHSGRRPAARRYPPAAVRALACPHCAGALSAADGWFDCALGHSFDVAKHGYLSLLGPRARTDTGDAADMVAARVAFLGAGHYGPIAAAVAERVSATGLVVDIGAGTGYYLRAALDAVENTAVENTAVGNTAVEKTAAGMAVDSSKYAARRAAADTRVLSVLADAWSALPLADATAGAVLSIFAPRQPAEIARVLGPGGVFVAVTPESDHLIELREQLTMLTVDDGKYERLAQSFAGLLTPVGRRVLRYAMPLAREEVSALVRMGPSARHRTSAELARQVQALPDRVVVTAAVTVSTFAHSERLTGTGGQPAGGPVGINEPCGTAFRRPG